MDSRGRARGRGRSGGRSGRDGGRGNAQSVGAGRGRGRGGGRFSGQERQRPHSTGAHARQEDYGSIREQSSAQYVQSTLVSCPPHKLPGVIEGTMALWTGTWRNAANLQWGQLKALLTTLARIPVAASLPPPRLGDVAAAVSSFLRHATAAQSGFRAHPHEVKLEAVEVVEKVFQRLVKFVWDLEKSDVRAALDDMLSEADGMLEARQPTHRAARNRITSLFDELDHPWAIKTVVTAERMIGQASQDEANTEPAWTHPNVAWLTDWNNFQPLKLPQMKVPGGRGDGVYDSPQEYFDTTIKLWTGMTFVDGNNALLPHCTDKVNDKVCDQPLWPVNARGVSEYQCRSRGCHRDVEFICCNRRHSRGLCRVCAEDRQRQLRGPPGSHASTHIYDANVVELGHDGAMYFRDVVSRRPPERQIHWKTTKRLSSPNLVGIVLLASRGASLRLDDEIYWAKVGLHSDSRDEFRKREQQQLMVELLEYKVDETGNPLLSKGVEKGAGVAIIDCQTFVPEFIPVLKALERQQEMPMPFQSGALVNLRRRNLINGGPHILEDEEQKFGDLKEEYGIDDLEGGYMNLKQPLPILIDRLVEESVLDPIVQIRRDESASNLLRKSLTSLVTAATLDSGQLESFLSSLRHPVHCTQGPPGTGKSYLGVVIVRALLIIRRLWMRVSPSVGQPPIVVLSYKNHAIDEFLVDLVKTEQAVCNPLNGLIRLGGGCSEPSLFRYQEANVVAAAPAVVKLASELDDLHAIASKIRTHHQLFSVILEAQLLVDMNLTDEGEEATKNRKEIDKLRVDAAMQLMEELARLPALFAVSSDEDDHHQRDDAEVNGEEKHMKVDAVVEAARTFLTSSARLQRTDMIHLYEGIRHYDPVIDPAEIIHRWMSGFVPVPPCNYPDEECAGVVDGDSMYCSKHRCKSMNRNLQLCEDPVALHRNFCSDHLCTAEHCKKPRLEVEQQFCAKHACFMCVLDGSTANLALDSPPRNVCQSHGLCWATLGDGCCSELAVGGTSYCAMHARVTCQGTTKARKSCSSVAISRSEPFCLAHRNQASSKEKAPSVMQARGGPPIPSACMAKTTKGKDCKAKALPGFLFCSDHANKAAQSPRPPREDVRVPISVETRVSDEIPAPIREKQNSREVVPVEIEPPQRMDLTENTYAVTDEESQINVDDDGASDSSGSFVDVDFVIGEDDIDESEHLQHLREVDEVIERVDEEDTFEDAIESFEPGRQIDGTDDLFVPLEEWSWEMSFEERWSAIRAMLGRWDPIAAVLLRSVRAKFDVLKMQLYHERVRVRTRMYEGRAVIGGTITGCVSRLEALRATKPFAILVEEASEVLEPLLFACLGSTTCKLEMIGDHLQLQPSIMTKFDFELINKINISMFERLIRAPTGNEVPSSVLSIQRRMRKNIADLTREFYSSITEIEDHAVCGTKMIPSLSKPGPYYMKRGSVNLLPLCEGKGREVPGVAPHLFFWTHDGPEERSQIGLSRVNKHEALMVCCLTKYLVRCGVPAESIAVLTPYKGQLMLMRNMIMSSQFGLSTPGKGPNPRPSPSCIMSTVDRFQGDEADIVIVSLVIDGKSRTPFVKLQNRMIVLLSRARIGMYILGNAKYFDNAPSHWQETLAKLHEPADSDSTSTPLCHVYEGPRMGDKLPLCCPVHRVQTHPVRSPKELQLSFCRIICEEVLPCKHPCGLQCHWPKVTKHKSSCDIMLDSPCSRHPRKLQCSNLCGATGLLTANNALLTYRCDVLVDLQLRCTHEQRVKCADEVDIIDGVKAWPACVEQAIAPYVYPDCKHSRRCTCIQYHEYIQGNAPKCTQDVDYVPRCGHVTRLKCYHHTSIVQDPSQFTCAKQVKYKLPRCGHEVLVPCATTKDLAGWSGTTPSTFGVIEDGMNYGPKDYPCSAKVIFRRRCGHETTERCEQAFDMALRPPPCSEPVDFENVECGHTHRTTCHDARKLHDTVLQSYISKRVLPPVSRVVEGDLSSYHQLGLNIACIAHVILVRSCGHEEEVPCQEVRRNRRPCSKTLSQVRPDCGHAVEFPCAHAHELANWQPWQGLDKDNLRLLRDEGVLFDSFPAPSKIPSSLTGVLKPCSKSLLLRRTKTCGHDVRLKCDVALKVLAGEASPPVCMIMTTKSLPCGHNVEAACNKNVLTIKCNEMVAKPCWNVAKCESMVDARCATSSTLLHCDSTIEWKCGSGRHKFDIPVCKHGPPTMCSSCSFDLLEEELAATQSICDATAEDIPWPPLCGPLKISWPTFASPIELSDADKIEFYTRKLILLEGFKRWVTKSKDEWSRAVFRPQIIPVFTIRKSVTRSPTELGRVEVKDFASNKSWNSIDVHEWTNANTNFMLPPARSTHQVIFGYLFSLGINSSPSDAPTRKFGAGHLRWIENQQNAFGYDCAFLAKKKNGSLGEEGTIRVWDPFVIAPCAEARVSAGQRDMVLKQAAPERTYWSTASRFVEYDRAAMLDTDQAGDNGVAGAAFSAPSVPTEYLEKLHQVLATLTYPWAAGIHTEFPWLGKQLFLGGETLSESVERQLREKLGFMRQGTPAKKIGPFAGRRFMQQVVKQQPFAEAELFHALELLWIQKENVTEETTLLESYATKMTRRGKACHPLLLLALARLTVRLKAAVKPSELFELFRQLYPEATELWMTREELEGMGVPADGDLPKKSISDPVSMTPAEQWEKLKTEIACKSKAMEELLKMVGLTKVKRFAIQLFKSAIAFQRMTPEKRKKNAITQNFCFLGNPGTGKTTVAKLFAQILHDSGMRHNGTAKLCTAQEVKDAGSDAFRDQIKKAMGGVIFIDEVYELDPMNDPKGKPIVAELLVAAEDKRDDLSVIIAGYEDDIQQKLYAFNNGIRSRFIEVTFDDFDEADLRIIWDGLLRDREWTSDENAGVVACRRLARCAGRKGFGNARAVRQVVDRVTQEAMSREDFDGITELRTIDVIGERPTKNPKLQLVMRELDEKIGWKRIKQRIRELIDICDKNYERELKGIDVIPVLMNRLFLGNPGTGKTTCAGIYGRILKQLGFLSNGDVVKKTAGDFVGQFIGQSQTKTNDILKQAQGKVLLIDEAYNLDDQWYGKQVLDVLVEKVQGTDSDDIAVLMLGYEHQMKEMLRTQNPGLKRRFPIEYAFYFDDYDDQEMLDIFMAACKRKSVRCSMDVAEAVIAQLSMQRHQANFGNAGAVELILKSAMANASMRPLVNDMIVLELADVENETLKRAKEDEGKAQGVEADDPLRLLDGLYRMENIKHELQRLSTRIQVAQQEGEEVPEIGHFVFRGSPGTGKTTVARVMGKILHRMGLLGSDKVVETSGLNMTGEYVGQTKKRVEEQLGQARGAILFIDEAYELGKGHYGEEAMTSLVAAMTDPRYAGMVVIIAGYPKDLDTMLDRNAGLKSRFTRFLDFRDWQTHDCLEFIIVRSNRAEYRLVQDTIDCLQRMFEKLRSFPGFGNGRDVDKVWKSLLECRAQRVLGKPELERLITLEDAEGAWQQVLGGRAPPIGKKLTQPVTFGADVKFLDASNQPPPFRVEHNHNVSEQPNAQEDEEPETNDETEEYILERVARDAGVDDAVWEELERAKEAYAQLLRDMKDAKDRRKRDEARLKLEKERAMQTKLRQLSLCPMGFQWHRCGGGWRCGGGSHYVSNEDLERKFMV